MTLKPQTKPRRLSACRRHPAEPATGICATCLRERLAFLDSSGQPEPSSSTSESIVLTALGGGAGARTTSHGTKAFADASSAFPLELRRSKSYSTSKCGASSSGLSEPRRKSCDVRARNTLLHLFNLNDEEKGLNGATKVESKNLGVLGVTDSVFESRGEDENGDKIRVSADTSRHNVDANEQRFDEVEEELKPMKELIELEWQSRKHAGKDLKDIAGSLWVAASVFSQKLKKWRLKQRTKKHGGGSGISTAAGGGGDLLQPEKLNRRLPGETQSEVGVYGHGRRSCDTGFSVDAGRMSLDDPIRFSFDEPRASWDGYMVARTIPRLAPMLSVFENTMVPAIDRSDYRMSVEEQMNAIIEDETTSGGSAQTRDYCSDSSSSQRQNSFDCSSSAKSSNKKTAALEVDERKSMANSKSSLTTTDVLHRMKFVVTEGETRELDFNSLNYSHPESFGSASNHANLNRFKKSGRWRRTWNILGFTKRLGDTHCGEVGRHPSSRMPGEYNEKQNEEGNGANGTSGEKLVGSGSCVSSRDYRMTGSHHRSLSVVETRGFGENREEFPFDRSRSVRRSPCNFDNGLLRFHLTPLWSSGSKSGKSRLKNSPTVGGSVLRLN